METITDLIRDVPIPKMVKIRQNFDRTHIPEAELAGVVTRELDREEIGGKILPGQKIRHHLRQPWNYPLCRHGAGNGGFCQIQRCRAVYCGLHGQPRWCYR